VARPQPRHTRRRSRPSRDKDPGQAFWRDDLKRSSARVARARAGRRGNASRSTATRPIGNVGQGVQGPGEADGEIEPERGHLHGDDVEQAGAQSRYYDWAWITLTPDGARRTPASDGGYVR
jgi:hypothetical protein